MTEKGLHLRVLGGKKNWEAECYKGKRTKGKHAYKLKHTQKPNTHTGIPVTVTCSL